MNLKNYIINTKHNMYAYLAFIILFAAFIFMTKGFNAYTDIHYYANFAIDIYNNNFHAPGSHWEYRSALVFFYYISFIFFGHSEFALIFPPALLYSLCGTMLYYLSYAYGFKKPHSFLIALLVFLYPPIASFLTVDINYTELGLIFFFLLLSFVYKKALDNSSKTLYFLSGVIVGLCYLTYAQTSVIIAPLFVITFYKYKKVNSYLFLIAFGAMSILIIETFAIYQLTGSIFSRFFHVLAHKKDTFFEEFLGNYYELSDKHPFNYAKFNILNFIIYSNIFLLTIYYFKKNLFKKNTFFYIFFLICVFYSTTILIQFFLGNIYFLWRYFTLFYIFIVIFTVSTFITNEYSLRKRLLFYFIYLIGLGGFYINHTDHYWVQRILFDADQKINEDIYSNISTEAIKPYYFINHQEVSIIKSSPINDSLFFFHGQSYFDSYVSSNNIEVSIEKPISSIGMKCTIYPFYTFERPKRFHQKLKQKYSQNNNEQINLTTNFIIWKTGEIENC